MKKSVQIAISTLIFAAASFAAVSYPTPPSTATIFTNAQNKTMTGYCTASNCSGGSGVGVAWTAPNQSTPSLSGSSYEFYNQGAGFDTLWYWHLGAHNSATHIEFSFNIMLDENSLTEGQAIENGPQQYVGGYKYSMTMQCEYPKQIWRVWNQAAHGWTATTVPCPKYTPNVWHKVKMYITTDHTNHTETYHSIFVDGVGYSIEKTVGVTNVGFHDNLGFQFQIDNKSTATGEGIHEWVDNVKLAVW